MKVKDRTDRMYPEEFKEYRRLSRRSTKLNYAQMVLDFTQAILEMFSIACVVNAFVIASENHGLNWPAVYRVVLWLGLGLLPLIVCRVFQWNKVNYEVRQWHIFMIDPEVQRLQWLARPYRWLYKLFCQIPYLFVVPLLLLAILYIWATFVYDRPFLVTACLMLFSGLLSPVLDSAQDETQFDLEDFWKAYDRRLAKPTLFEL